MKLKRAHILLSSLAILIAFLPSRIFWLTFFPLTGIMSDSSGYFEPALSILEGNLPIFDFRNPGYPVLIWLGLLISDSIIGVIILQSLITLSGALYLNYEMLLSVGKKGLIFSIGIMLFITTREQVSSETSIISESLFVGLILFYFGLLLRIKRNYSASANILIAIMLALIILVRPIGIVFGIPLIHWWFLYKGHMGIWKAIRMLPNYIPAGLIILTVLTYNAISTGHFTLSRTSAVNLFGATITYQHPGLSDQANYQKAIADYKRNLEESRLQTLRNSLDPRDVIPIYTEEYEKMWPVIADIHHNLLDEDSGRYRRISTIFPLLKKVGTQAVIESPLKFLKYHAMSFTFCLASCHCRWAEQGPGMIRPRAEILQEDSIKHILHPRLHHNKVMLDLIIESRARTIIEQIENKSFEQDIALQAQLLNSEGLNDRVAANYYNTLNYLDEAAGFNKGYFWSVLMLLSLFLLLYQHWILKKRSFMNSILLVFILTYLLYVAAATSIVYPVIRVAYPLEWIRYFSVLWLVGIFIPQYLSALRRP